MNTKLVHPLATWGALAWVSPVCWCSKNHFLSSIPSLNLFKFHLNLSPPLSVTKPFPSQSQLWRHVVQFHLLSAWTKSYGVTIQMTPLQQYFCAICFSIFYNTKFGIFFLSFYLWHS